jgi:hypothetical protein
VLYLYSGISNEAVSLTFSVMSLHYVIFDGSSAYVVDEQDMISITSKDLDTEVIFKSMNLDKASDFADYYNESL